MAGRAAGGGRAGGGWRAGGLAAGAKWRRRLAKAGAGAGIESGINGGGGHAELLARPNGKRPKRNALRGSNSCNDSHSCRNEIDSQTYVEVAIIGAGPPEPPPRFMPHAPVIAYPY